ncbi:MAG: leucine--tRNA ligase [Planctomycetes bacterium]|nr:leucine--tRNA ligase [Planctomycetota bacterium]
MPYEPSIIEPRWQKFWAEQRTFRTVEDHAKPKYYVLDMFPYPSGSGLHVGHPEGYTATDILARYKRMRGFNVLHPMGWDAFGLPAERAAERDGRHPADITKTNTDNFRRQIQRLGFSYDWDREINTSTPDYYRWTQWIFLRLHERGLAYRAELPVNWCPALGTVLANEEVSPEGTYKETGDPVEKRLMTQWMLRITAYAERLMKDLDLLDWPEPVKKMQREWIGQSNGAEVDFKVAGSERRFTVYTTRADTLFGVTWCVLAPEHPLVQELTTANNRAAVDAYIQRSTRRSDRERKADQATKTGVDTGARAVHPLTGELLPIWIADYVVGGYGTGAVMAVPAHDARDHEFARTYGLPSKTVVLPAAGSAACEGAFGDDGVSAHSGIYSGMSSAAMRTRITQDLEASGQGRAKVQYALRDWLFSRQRYWGEPFPMVIGADGVAVPLPDDALPVELPHLVDFKPTADGRPPLARAESWLQVADPRGGMALRETNTMPQWAGSCWYYLRYLDPKNDQAPFAPEKERYWMPVDLYVGGTEHAVLHLLYSRFWHKVLFDIGLVSTPEPFQKLFNQGMILAWSYQDASGKYWHEKDIEERDGKHFVRATGASVETRVEKMSKSKLNVVNPDDIISEYGADAMRLYEMFMGPLDMTKPWQTRGMEGVSRFLQRSWRLWLAGDDDTWAAQLSEAAPSEDIERQLHRTIAGVTEDLEQMRFNTAISKLMELVNTLTAAPQRSRATLNTYLLLVAPFCPHFAEEIWRRLGHKNSIAYAPWPVADLSKLIESTLTIPVSVNGKLRTTLELPLDATEAQIRELALADPGVQRHLAGATIRKVIYVPKRMLNLVVGPPA